MDTNKLLIPNQIIRSRRKSISLVINYNGDFIISAPITAKDNDIFKFINQKANWIIKKRIEQMSNAFKPLSFNDNEHIMLLGKQYKLKLCDITKVNTSEEYILLPKENTQAKLIVFLKRYAKQYLTNRVKAISEQFNFNYTSISITSAKTCWGSCSFSNKLHFTYKLVMCPQDVIDYIVLHELCHTKIKNHSAKFWSLVQSFNPYYKKHEKWLKANRGIIEII